MKTTTDTPKSKSRVTTSDNRVAQVNPKVGRKRGQTSPKASNPTATEITHDMIALRAWSIWTAGGCPGGQDQCHWHEAERQLRREFGQEY